MKASQVIRIALLLAGIFAAGVFTGRWTAPRLPTVVYTVPAARGTPEAILARMTAEVGLDAAQQARIRPLLEEFAAKMARTPPGAPERLDHFRQCTLQIRPVIRPDQIERYDRHVKAADQFFQRLVRPDNGK